MVEIKSIEALRPELQGISDKELERRMTELQMEVDRRKAEADRKAKAAEIGLKNAIIDRYLEVLAEMKTADLLPAELLTFYTNAGGHFTPHLKHKRLKV